MSVGFVCACASEDCAVNGCRRLRDLQQTQFAQYPPGPRAGCQPLQPLTEADVRRIVRDELRRIEDAKDPS
jgi:hypothetical protein